MARNRVYRRFYSEKKQGSFIAINFDSSDFSLKSLNDGIEKFLETKSIFAPEQQILFRNYGQKFFMDKNPSDKKAFLRVSSESDYLSFKKALNYGLDKNKISHEFYVNPNAYLVRDLIISGGIFILLSYNHCSLFSTVIIPYLTYSLLKNEQKRNYSKVLKHIENYKKSDDKDLQKDDQEVLDFLLIEDKDKGKDKKLNENNKNHKN